MEHESDFTQIVNGSFCTVTERLIKGLGNKGTSGYHPKYYIIEIDQNIENSSEDLRRLSVIQNSGNNHHLTLIRKTHKDA